MAFESIVAEVKVYRQGALVTRKGKAQLVKGENEFEALGIPLCADTDSIRLKLPAGITASGIQVKQIRRSELADHTYTEQIRRLEQQISSLNVQAKAWEQNCVFSAKNVDIGGIEEYITKLPERLNEVYEKIRTLEKEKNELARKQNAGKQETGYRFLAGLTSGIEGEVPFELQYRIDNASWEPQYEFRAEDGSEQLEARLRANIRQSTGEDWQDVVLALYTGYQNRSNTLPELSPRRLSYRSFTPMARMAKAAPVGASANRMFETKMMMAVEEECDALETAEPEFAMMDTAMGSASGNHDSTMSEYQIKGKWSIASGDTGAYVDVESMTVKAELKRLAIPLMDDCAFLTAEVPVKEFPQIMDANASIYLDGNYIGAMYVSSGTSEDHYTISMGRDEQLSVRRNTVNLETSSNLLKNQTRKMFEYEIMVTNRKTKEATLQIKDQIPVSTDKTIKIDSLQLSNGELNEETGEVKWNKTVAPSETLKIRLSYAVSYTKGKDVGL